MFASSLSNGRGFQVIGNPAYLKYDVWAVGGYAPTAAGSVVRGTICLASGTYSGGPTGGTGTTFTNGGVSVGGPQTFSTSGGGLSRVGSGAGGDYFYGTINEIVYYNTVLSTSDRQSIEGYLAWKWNTPTPFPLAHPYSRNRLINKLPTPLVSLVASSYSGSGSWFDQSGNGRHGTLENGTIAKM